MTKKDKKYKIILGDSMFFKQEKRIMVDTKKAIVIIICLIIICVFSIILAVANIIGRNTSYASTTPRQHEYSNIESNINILEILKQNTQEEYVEEFTIEEITLEYTTIYEQDETLPKGMVKVLQEGVDGIQQQTIKKIYINGELNAEERTDSKIINPSINKIVAVGTSKYTSNYKVKVGDTLYVTPNILSVMNKPDKEAEKIRKEELIELCILKFYRET